MDSKEWQDYQRRKRLANHENIGRDESDLDDRLAEGFGLLDDEDHDENPDDHHTSSYRPGEE